MSIIAPIEVITAAQIGRASDRFSERCRKNAISLPKDMAQVVLEDEGDALAQEMFETLRKRVERRSEMIVRHVKVDRTKTRPDMIKALGRKEYVDSDVLATMPTQGKDEQDVYFFPVKRTLLVAEYPQEFESRGLVPDSYAQMQVNIDDPEFADKHPNGVQWEDADGKTCCAVFGRWSEERKVRVGRGDDYWVGGWWLGGVRKIGSQV